MAIPQLAVNSEKRLLKPLENYFVRIWGDTRLWSHDLDHHKRVWNYAKELLECIADPAEPVDQLFADKLIIACLLHDSGMAFEKGEKHGKAGRKVCGDFLLSINGDLNVYEDLLFAIEHHDDKNYQGETSKDNRLLRILSAADDLDAFGHIGILRYFEIYTMRGIDTREIGQRVLENSASRFANFEANFSIFPDLVTKHRKRYMILREFFQGLSDEHLKAR